MTPLFLFGTLMWDALLADVAGHAVAGVPACLDDWHVERAAAGDWPVLVPGGRAEGLLTQPLAGAARDRLDWYEAVFGYRAEPVEVSGPDGPAPAMVYRAPDGKGSGEAWQIAAWIDAHGALTREAVAEIMRARADTAPGELRTRLGMIRARARGLVAARLHVRPETAGTGPRAAEIRVAGVAFRHEGFQRAEEWRLDHPRYDGSRSGEVRREITHVSDAATVLPYDPVRDRVLLVEQLRVGALAKGDRQPWMLEPVAGMIDGGETPELAALRELREEAGLDLGPAALRPVARYYPSPGGLAQLFWSYVALCDLPDGCDGLGGLASESEDIRSRLVSFPALMEMVASGEACNAALIVTAQWIALNRDRLRLNA